MSAPSLKVTLVQDTLDWQAPAANRDRFAALLGSLHEPTDLVVLPEMYTTGFTMDAAVHAETMQGDTLAWMAGFARARDVTLTGSLIIRDGDRYYNRLIWMPPDASPGWYDKRHLFRMANEHEHFAPGSRREVFMLKGFRICPLICYDLRFPVWSRGVSEFDLLLYVANWPAARRTAWKALLPARAVENQCWVAGVNRIGADGNGVHYAGDSGVFDFLGTTVVDLGPASACRTVTLELDELRRYREKFPAWRDADAFTLRD